MSNQLNKPWLKNYVRSMVVDTGEKGYTALLQVTAVSGSKQMSPCYTISYFPFVVEPHRYLLNRRIRISATSMFRMDFTWSRRTLARMPSMHLPKSILNKRLKKSRGAWSNLKCLALLTYVEWMIEQVASSTQKECHFYAFLLFHRTTRVSFFTLKASG